MRATDFTNTKQEVNKPIVYLDMDGVLADFFSEYAKLAGVESGNYRDIPDASKDTTLDKIVGTDFFARLPKFKSANDLIKLVIGVFGKYSICSSPLRGDFNNSEYQKKMWIRKNLSLAPDEVIITPKKEKYAVQDDGTPNILIDDRGINISKWRAAGGIGIKYQADEDSLSVVINGLRNAVQHLKDQQSELSDTLDEKKIPSPTKSQCSVGRANMSAVRRTQCVSLGYLAHSLNTGHTAGTGRQGKKGSGVRLAGKKMKGEKHGGPVKDYS